jgi:DNA-binding LytR/AlgR family response regulator
MEMAGECSSAIAAIQFLSKEDIDVLFLDINMPHLSGIQLLYQTKKAPLTILCTAHSEYALESYEVDVVDYLLKPISFNRFMKAIAKITSRLSLSHTEETPIHDQVIDSAVSPKYIYVKADYKEVRIEVESIKYIQAMEKYVRIFYGNENVMTLMSMANILELLNNAMFIRIHRSYIINEQYIEHVSGYQVKIGDKYIPISKGNRPAFISTIKEKM